ncbi:hypothetical protein [Arthrobacter castelli]|uniref:hypothetical protein n=1 Tax=Arthrobacter castelli TaxID=271431 RepID=UPI00056057D4|nr:hypothetical protein [Arthrobacter castelli]
MNQSQNDLHNDSATYSHVMLVTGARSWDDQALMRSTFNDAWRFWGSGHMARPLLVCGDAGDGADAMAGRVWRNAGFDTKVVAADWSTRGKKAGLLRNQQMVNLVAELREQGSDVLCTAFIDVCRKPRCPKRDDEQLMPAAGGHYSHGTMHARAAALKAGITTIDVLRP